MSSEKIYKIYYFIFFKLFLWYDSDDFEKQTENNMKHNVQNLKTSDISSDVFVIAPSQIDLISKHFGDAVAEAMNVRPLADKIRQIAAETLIRVLQDAKRMGE